MSKKSTSTSGRRRSSSWRWRSGSTGRRAHDGATRFLIESLARAAFAFIVAYPLWLLAQSRYTGALASCAEGVLRWLDRPPWIHALDASADQILIFSFVGGFERPVAVWDGETMGVFVLAPLVAVLAVPGMRFGARVTGVFVALLLSFCSCLLIVTLQTQLIVAAHASSQLGIRLFSPTRLAGLERLNHAVHSIGMLAIPSTAWLVSYAQVRWSSESRGTMPKRRLAILAAAPLLGWLLLASAPSPALETLSYHPRWSELVERNPDFVPARVNLALHLESSGEIDQAVAHYEQASLAEPERFETHFNLGSLLLRSGRAVEATPTLRTAVALHPEHAGANRNLGLALLRGDNRCEALPYLERALALDAAGRSALEAHMPALRRECNGER